MRSCGKWVSGVNADDSIVTAARVTLRSRLEAVVHFLDLSANKANETPEHVHQLRVFTRRSIAALDAYQELIPKKQAKWFRKKLRRIRKAAGDARDLDVFVQKCENENDSSHQGFLRQLHKLRRKAQRPIVRLEKRLILNHRLEKRIEKLLKSIASQEQTDVRLQQWAKSKTGDMAERFFASVPQEPYQLKQLHRFRVRSKELRYSMELFAFLFPPEFRTSIYPRVTQIQDQLGELNDHATACQNLNRWKKRTKAPREAKHLQTLIDCERRELQESLDHFRRWWTPSLADELASSLRSVVG